MSEVPVWAHRRPCEEWTPVYDERACKCQKWCVQVLFSAWAGEELALHYSAFCQSLRNVKNAKGVSLDAGRENGQGGRGRRCFQRSFSSDAFFLLQSYLRAHSVANRMHPIFRVHDISSALNGTTKGALYVALYALQALYALYALYAALYAACAGHRLAVYRQGRTDCNAFLRCTFLARSFVAPSDPSASISIQTNSVNVMTTTSACGSRLQLNYVVSYLITVDSYSNYRRCGAGGSRFRALLVPLCYAPLVSCVFFTHSRHEGAEKRDLLQYQYGDKKDRKTASIDSASHRCSGKRLRSAPRGMGRVLDHYEVITPLSVGWRCGRCGRCSCSGCFRFFFTQVFFLFRLSALSSSSRTGLYPSRRFFL